jgi:hypothetical protein
MKTEPDFGCFTFLSEERRSRMPTLNGRLLAPKNARQAKPVKTSSRRDRPIVAWHEMPDDVRAAVRREGRFLNAWNSPVLPVETSSLQYFNYRIEVRTPARIRPCPTGRFLGVAISRALHARLNRTVPPGAVGLSFCRRFARRVNARTVCRY